MNIEELFEHCFNMFSNRIVEDESDILKLIRDTDKEILNHVPAKCLVESVWSKDDDGNLQLFIYDRTNDLIQKRYKGHISGMNV